MKNFLKIVEKNIYIKFTQIENSFGAVLVSPVGEIDCGICSRLTPVMCTKPSNCMTTSPLLPLNAQHSPGRTPVYIKKNN